MRTPAHQALAIEQPVNLISLQSLNKLTTRLSLDTMPVKYHFGITP
jgi:hypothetical protein